MKGISKVLSVVLLLGAVLGFYGGAINIKDILSCKDYWEEQGEITDKNLGKLEDGVAQLMENEAAYVKGVADYEQGQADLAAGKKELADGKATLTAKTAELNQGKATLAASKKTIENGEAQLKALAPLESAIAQYQSGLASYATGYKAALDASTTLLSNLKTYGDTVTNQGNTLVQQAEGMDEGAEKIAIKNKGLALVAAGTGITQNVAAFSTNETLKNAPVAGFAQRLTADSTDPNGTGFLEILNSLNTAGVQGASNYITQCGDWLTSYYTPINPVNSANPEEATDLQTKTATLLTQILSAGLITDDAQKSALTPYALTSYAKGTSNPININAPEVILKLSSVFTQVQDGINAKKAQLAAGKVQYAAGEKKIADGEKQLQEGRITLRNGEATVAAGEQQLAEGEAKLAQYEDGEAALKAGLDTLIATETYTGLESIKARLGKNFSYLKDNNKNIDLDKASLAVKTGRDFSSDSSVKITKEIKTRAIGQGLGLFGAVLALVAGLVGLSKKNKTAGILALLAAAAAVVGIITFNGAGFEMSEIAGSTLTGMSAIYAMVVVAVAGVLGGIAHLAVKKDA